MKLTQEQVRAINRAEIDDLPPTIIETAEMCQLGCGTMTLMFRTLVDMDGNRIKVGGMHCKKCRCGYSPNDIDKILSEIPDGDEI